MKIREKLFLFAALMILVGQAIANPGEAVRFSGWETVGPAGGDVRAIAIDPKDKDKLYITTLDSQVYASSDAGKSWRFLASFSRPQIILDDIIVDSQDSDSIYVAGHRHKSPGGFFYSRDGGSKWKEADELKNEAIHGMTQSTLNPDMLAVGGVNGVWISYNSGEDWIKPESKTMPVNVDSLAIDPRDTKVIYAGTWWRAYKTIDGGKNWKLIKNGMIDDSDVFSIEIDPKNPDHIIASACSGIYESFNGGELWKKFPGIPSSARRTRTLRINPANSSEVYAGTTEGFWMTPNGGGSWGVTTQKELEVNGIAVHPADPKKVYIATNNYGVMVSADGGKNFKAENGNFTSRFMHSVTPDIQNPNRLYATTNNTATGGGFVFISNDGGRSWKQSTANMSVIRVNPFSLLQDAQNPNMIYLGTNQGIFRSSDRGATWAQVKGAAAPKKPAAKGKKAAPAPKVIVKKVAAITDVVNTLEYANDGKNGIFAATNKGLFRSNNIAAGWEKLSLGAGIDERIFAVAASEAKPQRIWAGTVLNGLMVSNDSGLTWKKAEGVPSIVPISSIRIDPINPDVVYVGTKQALYISRDGGENWSRRGGNLPPGDYDTILINPKNPEEVFAGSAMESSGGIYHSLDAGKNWKRLDSKEINIASRRIRSLAFDPNNQNRLFVGTHSSGIFVIERTAATAAIEPPTGRARVVSPK